MQVHFWVTCACSVCAVYQMQNKHRSSMCVTKALCTISETCKNMSNLALKKKRHLSKTCGVSPQSESSFLLYFFVSLDLSLLAPLPTLLANAWADSAAPAAALACRAPPRRARRAPCPSTCRGTTGRWAVEHQLACRFSNTSMFEACNYLCGRKL